MDKNMVNFKVHLKPGPNFEWNPQPLRLPDIPRGGFDSGSRDPISLWVGLDGNIVLGMWLKVLTAVTTVITTRPGVQNAEICRVLRPGVTLAEVEDIVRWLVKRGSVEHRANGDDKEVGNWPSDSYFLAFKGLDFGPSLRSQRAIGGGQVGGTCEKGRDKSEVDVDRNV
jgi:hypothetical protein